MPGKAGTLEVLARQVGFALQPLQARLAPGNVIQLFAELGLRFPPQLLQPGLVNALNAGGAAAGALPNLLTQLANSIDSDNEAGILQAGVQLVQQIVTVVSTLEQIGTQLGNIAGSLPGMSAAEVTSFAQNLPSRLLSYLLISYLEGRQPGAAGIGSLLGVLDYLPNPGVPGDPAHPSFTIRQLQLSRLGDALKSPLALFRTLYGWGDASFDGTLLIPRLNAALNLLGLPSDETSSGAVKSLDSSLFSVQANPASNPPGLVATLKTAIPSGFDLTLPLNALWSVRAQVQGAFTPGLQATLTPPATVSLQPLSGTLNGLLEMDLIAKGPDAGHPLLLFGQTGGSRLQMSSFTFAAGLKVTSGGPGPAAAEPFVRIEVAGGKAVIDLSKGDGFLNQLLSGLHVESDFGLKATWDAATGAHFDGSANLELEIPTHVNLGPVELQAIYVSAGLGPGGTFPLEVSVSLGATLGPLQVAIDRVGVHGDLTFPPAGGNLGAANLAFRFKPPTGLGIAIDAGPITGGGFISFDEPNGRYAGILQLRLLEIGVTAIAVLDTRLPGGQSGYSFLIIIAVTLPPIQLGFGFTLTGIGGLAGINRTMVTDAIVQGLRNGVLDHLMFPPDPVRNAPQIISDIRTVFPPAADRYVFGPMLQLAWGTPSLITGQLGVILEVPDPVRLVLIGQLKMALPTPETALVEFHVDLLGVIDFGQKLLWIAASVHDSRITIYSVYGDMALRLFWGDPPNFAFSLGGWNPHFNPPPGMPELRRMTVAMGFGDNPRLTSQTYFAVTSNSFQFGAQAELYAEAAGFNVRGWIGYDALVIFAPFSFIVDIGAGVELRRGSSVLAGIHLSGHLAGPNPWHIWGEACLSLLFFDICVGFDVTLGDKQPDVLPTADPWPLLEAAIQKPESWSATLPPAGARCVSLAVPQGSSPPLLVDPLGGISLHQKVLPLNRKITKFGEAKPVGPDHYNVTAVKVGGVPAATWTAARDYFAGGQFQELSDAEKLSRPSFELMDAGVSVASAAVAHGGSIGIDVEYETFIIDAPDAAARFAEIYKLRLATQMSMVSRGAAARNPAWKTGLESYKPGPGAIKPYRSAETVYVVVSTVDLSPRPDVAAPGTMGEAHDALAAHLEANPGARGTLQVVPVHDLEEVTR